MTRPFGLEDLAGRRVLVTGASSGIGAEVALGFARCGARVAFHYRSGAARAEALRDAVIAGGGEAVTVGGDLANPVERDRVAEQAVARLGGLDILVNNAGVLVERRPVADSDDDFYDSIFDPNLRAVVGLTRALIPELKRQGRASIINTSSRAAFTGGGNGSGLYAASKAALNTLTISLARELGPFGIRVNTVAPGMIRTPIHDGTMDPAAVEAIATEVPLGRLGEPDDCVGAYLFLASERLAGYISGATILVSGGRS